MILLALVTNGQRQQQCFPRGGRIVSGDEEIGQSMRYPCTIYRILETPCRKTQVARASLPITTPAAQQRPLLQSNSRGFRILDDDRLPYHSRQQLLTPFRDDSLTNGGEASDLAGTSVQITRLAIQGERTFTVSSQPGDTSRMQRYLGIMRLKIASQLQHRGRFFHAAALLELTPVQHQGLTQPLLLTTCTRSYRQPRHSPEQRPLRSARKRCHLGFDSPRREV